MRPISNPKSRVSIEQISPTILSADYINSTFAPLDSPDLIGTPTAPTASKTSNSNQLATTKFVKTAIADLVDSAPEELDTLKELADALGDNESAINTINTNLSKKLDSNSANYVKSLSISGKTITVTKGNNTTSTLTTQDTVYTHPTTSGNKHIPSGGSSGQFLKWSSDGTAVWAADNDTHYTSHLYAGSGTAANASTSNGNTKITLTDNSTVRNSVTIKGTGAASVTSDANGVITVNSTNTTYGVVTTSSNGLAPKLAGGTTKYLRADGTWQVPPDTNTTYSVVSTSANGLAPKLAGGTAKYLRADGQWATPPDTNTTYTAASATPKAPGTAAVGSSAKYAREDHVHPAQSTISGNASTATKLATGRTITVKITINQMVLSGSATFDGSGNITIDMGSISRAQLMSSAGGGSSCGDCSDWCEAEGGGQC